MTKLARRPRVPSDSHIKSILTRNFGANTYLIHALAKEVKALRMVTGRRRKIPVLVVSKDDGQDEIYYDSRFASVMVVHKRDELDMATCKDPAVQKFNDLWWPCNLNQFTFYAKNN